MRTKRKNLLIRESLYKLRFLPLFAYIIFGVGVPDSSAQFKWTAVSGGPAMGFAAASDGHGTVVTMGATGGEVSPGVFQLFYSVGQYGAGATPTIKWGPEVNYDTGLAPSVALAYCAVRNAPNKNLPALECSTGVVEVHMGGDPVLGGSATLWYRVGVINGPAADHIAWKTKSQNYDNGNSTSVAISGDASTVVDVHNGAVAPNNTWYKVGKVDWKTGIIKWGKGTKYGTGYAPQVAVSGSKALVVHGVYSPANSGFVYVVGQINSSSLTISGLESSPTVYDSNVNDFGPCVAISSCEFGTGTKAQPAIEVHSEAPGTSSTNHAYYRIGTFDGNTLTLGPSQPYGTLGSTSGTVTMGSDGVPISSAPKPYSVGTSLCPSPPPIK